MFDDDAGLVEHRDAARHSLHQLLPVQAKRPLLLARLARRALIDQPCASDQLRQHHRHGLKRLDLHILVTARLDLLNAEHANRLLAAHERNARKALEPLFPVSGRYSNSESPPPSARYTTN